LGRWRETVGNRLWRNSFIIICLSVIALSLTAGPVLAKSAEPPVATRAWYWEESQTQEQTLPDGSKVTIETPNPFCPSIPGQLGAPEQTCAEGRLPMEIQNGDYETPNKLSAVNFDLSLVPVGSEVTKFNVTFLEAKAGCYDSADEGTDPNWCEETDPINIDGKELRACAINDFFGDGDSRPYKEVPKYACTDADPTAKRKEVKGKDDTVEHVWTFDLTVFAQDWVKNFTTNTSIMITGQPPKGYKPGDTNEEDNWRVVLMGAKAPEGIEGVVTEIEFIPGETTLPPTGTTDPTTTGGTTTGGTTTGGTISTTGTDSFDTGGSDFGSTSGGGGATTPTDTSSPGAAPVAVEGAESTPQGLPGYVWLAVLAGVALWSVFRSVVLESAKGIRPDGVLAQIQRINAQQRGGAVAAAADSPSAASSFFSGIKSGAGSLLGKLKLTRKG
jgi:hypothetical protein